jgi:PAS domain S-box-containing protein
MAAPEAHVPPEAATESEAFFVCDDEGHIVEATAPVCQMTGYSRDELLGRSLNDLTPSSVETPGAPLWLKELQTRETLSVEARLRCKGGAVRSFQIRLRSLVLNGRRHAVASVGWRRRASDRLPDDRQFTQLILNSIGTLVVVLDSRGRIVLLNKAVERVIGHTFATARGRYFWEFLASAEAGRVRARFPATRCADVPERALAAIVAPDGRVRRILWSNSVLPAADGSVRYIVATGKDVGSRTRALAEIRAGQELLALITEAVPVLISYVDRSERYVFNNGRFREWFGLSPADARFRPLEEVHGPEVYGALRPHVGAVLGGRKVTFELAIPRRGEAPRWVQMTYLPHAGAKSPPEGFFVLATDVTDRRRVEEDIRRLNEDLERRIKAQTAELRESLAEMEAFTYTVAHDLRAPLRAMAGFSQVLLKDFSGSLGAEAKDYVERIAEASRRMDALIQDLLSYSRVTRVCLRTEALDLDRLVAELVAELGPELRQRHARIEVDPGLPRARGDATAVRHVLSNLLSNALKFVAPGVTPAVRVRGERGEGRTRICVEDNGIGIAPEHHERIFGVFQRLHRTEEYPGTGIGLAIVKKAVERMNGVVGLESAPGRGSRFWVDLPAA